MTTTVVYGDTSDGYIYSTRTMPDQGWSTGADAYPDARSGYNPIASNTTLNSQVGQTWSDGSGWNSEYEDWIDGYPPSATVYEAFLAFDTSAIADADTISAVVLRLTADQTETSSGTVQARLRDWGTSLTTADWVAGASLSGLTLLATTSASWTINTGYDFTSDANFPSGIDKTGFTRILLCSADTTSGVMSLHYRLYRSADTTGTTSDPKLTITHSSGASVAIAGMPLVRTHRMAWAG